MASHDHARVTHDVEHIGFENASNSQRAEYLAARAWANRGDEGLTVDQATALAQVYATLALEDAHRESFED